MALQKQTAHMPLIAGLDTKSDPRAMKAPKMARLENVVFDEVGGFRKRPGMAPMGLGTLSETLSATSTRAVATRDDELVMFAGGRAYTWSPGAAANETHAGGWLDRGRFESVLVDQQTVLFDRQDQVHADLCTAGGFTMIAWYVPERDAVRVQLVDTTSGSILRAVSDLEISSSRLPRCRAVGDALHCYYIEAGALKVVIFEPLSDLSADPGPVTIEAANVEAYDVDMFSSSVALLAYTVSDVVKLAKVNALGVVTQSHSTGRTAVAEPAGQAIVAVHYNATADKIALVRVKSNLAAAPDEDTVYLDWIKAVDLTDDAVVDVAVETVIGTEGDLPVMNAGVLVLSDSTAHVFFDTRYFDEVDVWQPMLDQVRRHTVTFAGVVTKEVLCRRSKLGSRPTLWTDGDGTERGMVHVLHSSPQQSTYFLIDTAYVVGTPDTYDEEGQATTPGIPPEPTENDYEVGLLARLMHAEGPGDSVLGASIHGLVPEGYVGHLPQIERLSSTTYTCALSFRRALEERRIGVLTRNYSERGIRKLTYTLRDSRAYRGVQEGRALYLPGGYLAQYDGRRVVESGFLLWTEGVTHEVTSTGGALPAWIDDDEDTTEDAAETDITVVSYRFYWEWMNAAGELERSTHAGAINIDMHAESMAASGGAATLTNKVTFTIPVLPFTSKPDVVLAVYRCPANDPTAYYRISSIDPSADDYVRNNVNADTITYVDDGAIDDTTLVTREPDYLNGEGGGGAVELDNVAPPATHFVAAGQGRLFTCNPEDRTLLHHSKIRLAGDAVAFNDALTIRLPQEGGDATAVEVTDGAIIAFKEEAIFVVSGQGPDNLGQGPYPSPQRVTAGVGCTEIRSIAKFPGGHIFKSAKGFYQLDPAFSVTYVGAGVEDYNSLTITGAVAIVDKHRIQFVATATGMLVYDYLIGEWALWPNRTGISATSWLDAPVHLEAATGPWMPQATYADDAAGYATLLETGWIKFADLQGCQRIWWTTVLGAYRSACVMNVAFAYDYIETFDTAQTFTPSGLSAGDRLQKQFEPRVQRGEAMKMRIYDSQDGVTAWREGLSLTGIGFDYGVLPYQHKSPR